MLHAPTSENTLVPSQGSEMGDGTLIRNRTIEGTMIEHCTGTLVPRRRGHMTDDEDLTDNLGTMVINSDGEEDSDSTMKRSYLFLFSSSSSFLYFPFAISHSIYFLSIRSSDGRWYDE